MACSTMGSKDAGVLGSAAGVSVIQGSKGHDGGHDCRPSRACPRRSADPVPALAWPGSRVMCGVGHAMLKV